MRSIVWVALLSVTAVITSFAVKSPSLSGIQIERYNRLINELIAPCCWREPIAIHRSQESLLMLDEVQKLVAEGRSEEEIKTFYVKQYGPRILADPPGIQKYWLYLIPFSLLGCLTVAAVFRLRSLIAATTTSLPSAPPELLAQVRKETENLLC